jgi:hypothetical protein
MTNRNLSPITFRLPWWKKIENLTCIFVRITSGVGGGEFTKTLRKVCTCQKLKFSFLLLEYCKIRECYAVANTFNQLFCLCRLPAVNYNVLIIFIRFSFGLVYVTISLYSSSSIIQYRLLPMNQIFNIHDENCDTLTFLSCSWQRCKLNFQYFFIMGV